MPLYDLALTVVVVSGCEDSSIGAQPEGVRIADGEHPPFFGHAHGVQITRCNRTQVAPRGDLALPPAVVCYGHGSAICAEAHGMPIPSGNSTDLSPGVDIALTVPIPADGDDGAVDSQAHGV